MSRRKRVIKKRILPDVKYKKDVIAKFINYIMQDGQKSLAEGIVYYALEELSKKTNKVAYEAFLEAIGNVRPNMEVRSRRIGGATYQVPVEVRDERSVSLALRWIIKAALSRGEKSMKEKLLAEMLDAYNNKGKAVKDRENLHKMAMSNQAFAHYKF